ATWHLPASHYLEAWGDLEASDGTVSIQQPLLAPLYDTISALQLLSRMLRGSGEAPRADYQIGRAGRSADAATLTTDFESSWRRWLHDGVVSTSAETAGAAAPRFAWNNIPAATPTHI